MIRRFWQIFWLITFVLGSIASLFYVLGMRLHFASDSPVLIKTGILDVSSVPERAHIFLNGKQSGLTPHIFRSVPLGPMTVRLEKNGYHPFELTVTVDGDMVTFLRRIFLVPQRLQQLITVLGSEEMVFMHPEYRGFIHFLPHLKAAEAFNLHTGKRRLYEFAATPKTVFFTDDEMVHISFADSSKKQIIAFPDDPISTLSTIIAEGVLSPDRKKIVLFQNNSLFLKDLESASIEALTETTTPIHNAWWMANSDDILVITKNRIFIWNSQFGGARMLTEVVDIDDSFYFSGENRLVYKDGKIWKSMFFGEK